MDYLKALRDDPDLAEEFDSLFDFFLLDELSPRDDAEGRYTFSLPGMAFARDGSGGEYHLLEDGSIGYNGSEGQAGRLAENMDDLFSLIVSCICWHDCCDAKEYADSKTLEEYGQRQRNINLEDMDRRLFRHTGPSGWRKTRTSTPTTTCSAIFWRKTPKPIPSIRAATATGSTGRCRKQTAICPFSPLAGGTATIRSTSAMTQGARSAPCMCASSTLKPVTRSRRKEGNSDGMAETGADSELGERCTDLRRRKAI